MRPTPPGWPDDRTVTRPHAEVVIDSETHKAQMAGVRAQLSTDLPPQMRAAPGVTVGSASVSVVAGEPATRRAPTPWLDSWARELFGKSCTVRMGYGSALVDVMTGQIADTGGETNTRTIDAEVQGLGAWLRDPVSVWPMGRVNHYTETDSASELHVGLTPLAVLDLLARGAGLHSLPAPADSTVLYVPMQSTLWPEDGSIISAGEPAPGWEPAPWGWGVWPDSPLSVTFRPRIPRYQQTSWDTQLTVWTSADGGLDIRASLGPPNTLNPPSLRIQVDPTQVLVTIEPWSGAPETLASYSGAIEPGPVTVRLRQGNADLYLPDGTRVNDATYNGYRQIRTLRMQGRGAGVTLARSDQGPLPEPPTLAGFTPTFLADQSLAQIDVSPWIDQRPRWDVMNEIVASEGGALLVTGDGRLLFLNRDSLIGSATVAEVPVRNLAALRWRTSADFIRTGVRVGYQPVEIQLDSRPAYTVWQPEDEVLLERGKTVRLFGDLSVDAAIGIDTGIDFVTSGWQFVGSTVYAWRSDTSGYWSGTTTGQDLSDQVEIHVAQLSPRRIMVELRWDPPDATFVGTVVFFNYSSPTIRAYQAVRWLDEASVSVGTGVSVALGTRELSIPATPWRQTEHCATEWARSLARMAGLAQPVVEWVELAAPDPRLEVGDIVNAVDPDVTGVNTRALIVDQRLTWDGSRLTQRLALRLLSPTFANVNAAHTGRTFADMNDLMAGRTFADMANDPMGRL
ncbi:hypothetical protein CLV30_12815 [Haloactinopolyspora alba]|uniref:Tail protein n=1 Tax=Haloactinopolyspora alba TaxID=648780 RepID=A0A2P8DEW2_9ACTN|nr:hypothetical protein [Haloactinopolyspora alba]PSK95763.1 hypothetical protein CLV30_12815 [Haloactinopolyspora alba]